MSQGYLYDEGNDLITRKESSGGLPDPSEASAGYVLSLDEDKSPVWSAPSGGGGDGGLFIVHVDPTASPVDITVGADTVSAIPLECTFNDIIENMQNGKICFLYAGVIEQDGQYENSVTALFIRGTDEADSSLFGDYTCYAYFQDITANYAFYLRGTSPTENMYFIIPGGSPD